MIPTDQELIKWLREIGDVWVNAGAVDDEKVAKRYSDIAARLTSLSQANERMAGALTKIAAASVPDYTDFGESYDEIREIARSALSDLSAPPADSIEKAIGELPEDWWEIDTEKCVDKDGKPHHYLCEVRFPEDPSVGGEGPTPLSAIRAAMERIQK